MLTRHNCGYSDGKLVSGQVVVFGKGVQYLDKHSEYDGNTKPNYLAYK